MDKSIFMLCNSLTETEVLEKYTNPNVYIAQEKKDGERCIAIIQDKCVILFNRRGRVINNNFNEICNELMDFPNCIIDGEICSYDDKFESLQRRALTKNEFKQEQLEKEIPCYFWVFDILKIGESDMMKATLKERIREMSSIIPITEHIKLLPYISVENALKIAHEKNGEGIVVKYLNGYYESKRSNNWLKCKFFKETSICLQSYTINNAGIRCEDNLGNAVQVSGQQHLEVKNQLDSKGFCEVIIQYLEKTKENRYRFISYRGLK